MTKLGPWIVGALLLGVIGWEACQGSRSLAEWQADTTRTFQGVQAREDSAEAMLALGMRLVEQGEQAKQEGLKLAQRGAQSYRAALSLRDSLASLGTPPDTCLPYLLIASRSLDSLEGAYRDAQEAVDSLRGAQEALRRSNTALLWAYQLRGESIDSLTALVRRAPGGCRILGLPCPVAVIGYGAVLSDGVVRAGPSVGIGFKVPF